MQALSRIRLCAVAFALSACQGTIGDVPRGASSPPDNGDAAPRGAESLPARIRRLSANEYDAAVGQLFGMPSTFGAAFTPDARQDGFTMNDAQRVDPVFAMQADE